jgi:hypothetical protein
LGAGAEDIRAESRLAPVHCRLCVHTQAFDRIVQAIG